METMNRTKPYTATTLSTQRNSSCRVTPTYRNNRTQKTQNTDKRTHNGENRTENTAHRIENS